MQNAAMNNAEKQGEKWANKTQSVVDRGVSELKSLSETDIKSMASDLGEKVKGMSGDVYRKGVNLVKRYPAGAALGIAALGFFAGVWATRSRH